MDQPADIMREQLVVNDPSCKLIPLIDCSAVNRDTPFGHLVLARLEIRNDFLGYLGQVSAIDKVVGLEENGSQSGFSNWVVLEIELVKSMERIRVSLEVSAAQINFRHLTTHMHIKRIDTQIISRQVDRLKDFLQSKMFAISEHDDLIWALLHLTLDEAQ